MKDIATHAVRRGDKDAIAFQNHGLSDVDAVHRFPFMPPQFLAGLAIVAADSIAIEQEDLPPACQRRQHRRAIAGSVVAAVPDFFSGRAIVSDEGSSGGSRRLRARIDYDHVVKNERRAAHPPGNILIVFQNIDGPLQAPARQSQANQLSRGPKRKDIAAGYRGRRPRTRTAQHGVICLHCHAINLL